MEKYFAKVNKKTKEVEGVFVFPEDYSPSSSFPADELWVESFRHEENPPRKHYPGIGYTYYEEYDAFVPPNMFATEGSRVLDLESFTWVPAVPYPNDADPDDYFYVDEYKEWITLKGPENNSGLSNADLLGFSTTTTGKLWNVKGKVVGIMSDITPRMQQINESLEGEIDLLQ